eukprot:1221-Eustigmatos_ZCMA.PRE.1
MPPHLPGDVSAERKTGGGWRRLSLSRGGGAHDLWQRRLLDAIQTCDHSRQKLGQEIAACMKRGGRTDVRLG